MKEYRLHWHTIVGAVLLFALWITIFFPGLSFSADRYVDAAVSANRYAMGKDENITGAGGIVEEYGPGGAGRAGIERTYRRRAREITGGDTSISRLFLARWALTVEARLDFEGIQLREGMTLKSTGVRGVFRLWGWLIYLPFLAVTFTLVFMLVKGRTFSGILLFDGLFSILCECLGHFLIPSMLWDEIRRAAISFELVGEEALNQYGTGERFVKELFSRCSGVSWSIVIVLSVLTASYSIWLCCSGREAPGTCRRIIRYLLIPGYGIRRTPWPGGLLFGRPGCFRESKASMQVRVWTSMQVRRLSWGGIPGTAC